MYSADRDPRTIFIDYQLAPHSRPVIETVKKHGSPSVAIYAPRRGRPGLVIPAAEPSASIYLIGPHQDEVRGLAFETYGLDPQTLHRLIDNGMSPNFFYSIDTGYVNLRGYGLTLQPDVYTGYNLNQATASPAYDWAKRAYQDFLRLHAEASRNNQNGAEAQSSTYQASNIEKLIDQDAKFANNLAKMLESLP